MQVQRGVPVAPANAVTDVDQRIGQLSRIDNRCQGCQLQASKLRNSAVWNRPQFQSESMPRKTDATRLMTAAISIKSTRTVLNRYAMDSQRGMMCGS